jgi:hypothetical protein
MAVLFFPVVDKVSDSSASHNLSGARVHGANHIRSHFWMSHAHVLLRYPIVLRPGCKLCARGKAAVPNFSCFVGGESGVEFVCAHRECPRCEASCLGRLKPGCRTGSDANARPPRSAYGP